MFENQQNVSLNFPWGWNLILTEMIRVEVTTYSEIPNVDISTYFWILLRILTRLASLAKF